MKNRIYLLYLVILIAAMMTGCNVTDISETCHHVQIFVMEERVDPLTGVSNNVPSVGAVVVLTSQETNKFNTYTEISRNRGVTDFYDVELGLYEMTVSKEGFVMFERSNIRIGDAKFVEIPQIILSKSN
jgi:predicted small secreted protein